MSVISAPRRQVARRQLASERRQPRYNIVSAVRRSLRGLGPHVLLYWFVCWPATGIAATLVRRFTRFAAEGGCMAEHNMLGRALAEWEEF
jgi:replication-associated recombination protein RarA